LGVEEVGLTQEETAYIVTQYMLGQGWGLISPTLFAVQIWDDLQKKNAVHTATAHTIKRSAWQKYAVILHDACRTADNDERYQLAWREFGAWLGKQAHQVTSHLQEQEDVVQETLIELQSKLECEGLRAPRTLWAYALQTQKRKQIDMHRKRSAKKRGEDKIISLEEMGTEDDAESRWEETLAVNASGLAALENSGANKRGMENEMANREIEEQLQIFFEQHLPTPLQRQVAARWRCMRADRQTHCGGKHIALPRKSGIMDSNYRLVLRPRRFLYCMVRKLATVARFSVNAWAVRFLI